MLPFVDWQTLHQIEPSEQPIQFANQMFVMLVGHQCDVQAVETAFRLFFFGEWITRISGQVRHITSQVPPSADLSKGIAFS